MLALLVHYHVGVRLIPIWHLIRLGWPGDLQGDKSLSSLKD